MLIFKVLPSLLNYVCFLEQNSVFSNFNGRFFCTIRETYLSQYRDLRFHTRYVWLTDELRSVETSSRISASEVNVLQNCCRASCDHVTCVVRRCWSKKEIRVFSWLQTPSFCLFTIFWAMNWMPGSLSLTHMYVCMNMCTCSWCHLQMLYLCILYKNKMSHFASGRFSVTSY